MISDILHLHLFAGLIVLYSVQWDVIEVEVPQ